MDIKTFQGDVERLRPLIRAWATESKAGEFGMAIDPERLLGHAEFLSECQDTELLVMESKEGRVLGVMGLVLSPNIVESGSILNEHIWFVLPEHRSRSSFGLIQSAAQWGRARGCSHYTITASKMMSGLHDTLCRLYERLGFSHFETIYIKAL